MVNNKYKRANKRMILLDLDLISGLILKVYVGNTVFVATTLIVNAGTFNILPLFSLHLSNPVR